MLTAALFLLVTMYQIVPAMESVWISMCANVIQGGLEATAPSTRVNNWIIAQVSYLGQNILEINEKMYIFLLSFFHSSPLSFFLHLSAFSCFIYLWFNSITFVHFSPPAVFKSTVAAWLLTNAPVIMAGPG